MNPEQTISCALLGVANYDFALYKNTPIRENVAFEFRVEAFNLFNRVQFGSPNTVVGNAQFGNITTDLNTPPRLLQWREG